MYPLSPGKIRSLLIAMLMMFALSACGQKGDLYHSRDKQTAVDSTYANV